MPEVEFQANGGTATGYLAEPESGKGPGVVVLQEWWGLDDHIRGSATGSPRRGSSRSHRTSFAATPPSSRTRPSRR